MSFASPKQQKINTSFPKQNKHKNIRQLLFIAGFTGLLAISGSATIFLISSFFSIRNDASYPTSLPWVGSKSQCEEFGRTWRNDQCWDDEHSHDF